MKTKIVILFAAVLGLVGCNSTDTTAENAFAGVISLVLANNPQYEPDVVTIVDALQVSSTPITLGSVATVLTAAKVNPLVTNILAPTIVSVYQTYVQNNPTGGVAQANAAVAASLNGALQLYIAEHPMVLPNAAPAANP